MKVVSVLKPGIVIPEDDIDRSEYGGWTEIIGFSSDLAQLGYSVHFNYIHPFSEAVFIFPSSAKAASALGEILSFTGVKIQCLTDLNLMYRNSEIGEYVALNQVKGSPSYFPFERYLQRTNSFDTQNLDSKFAEWRERPVRSVYAGGSRNGERDAILRRYMSSNVIDTLIGSFAQFGNVAVKPKIDFVALQCFYRNCRFSLLISDPLYCSLGMMTQRLYEYLFAGVVPIVDVSCAYMVDFDRRFPIVRTPMDFVNVIKNFDLEAYIDYYTAAIELIEGAEFSIDTTRQMLRRLDVLQS